MREVPQQAFLAVLKLDRADARSPFAARRVMPGARPNGRTVENFKWSDRPVGSPARIPSSLHPHCFKWVEHARIGTTTEVCGECCTQSSTATPCSCPRRSSRERRAIDGARRNEPGRPATSFWKPSLLLWSFHRTASSAIVGAALHPAQTENQPTRRQVRAGGGPRGGHGDADARTDRATEVCMRWWRLFEMPGQAFG